MDLFLIIVQSVIILGYGKRKFSAALSLGVFMGNYLFFYECYKYPTFTQGLG
jgi:hypothetical protein